MTDFDFECLCKDLFEEVLGVRLELFTPGADGGVDLRYMSDRKEHVVIQCKHWIKSGRAKLVRHMLNRELSKVRRFRPTRYILATTVEMTKNAKDELYQAFQPFVKSPSDIFGLDEINALLRQNPAVVRRHIRLWLNDAEILEAMISKNIIWRSFHFVEEIQDTLRTYVPTGAFHRTLKVLDSHHVCIISGVPGVGKTTLAQVLCARFASEGYELVEISENIEDVYRMWNPDSKQIFVYDDFLGQSTLEDKLFKNEDRRLLSLTRVISKDPLKRLIFTSRNYILAQGKARYERLDRENLLPITCVVDLSEFHREARARILYNHAYWSNWPAREKAVLARPEHYRRIIDHRSFNPRVLADVLKTEFDASLGNAASQLEASLADPMRVWRHVFENQLTEKDRVLLSTLFSLGGEAHLERLQEALSSFGGWSKQQIRHSLKILDGTFVKVTNEPPRQFIEFSNPSVNDFFVRKMADDMELVSDILQHAFSFDQVANLWSYHSESGNTVDGDQKIDLRELSHEIEEATLATIQLSAKSTRGFVGRLVIALRISADLELPRLSAKVAELISVQGRVYGGDYEDIAELIFEVTRARHPDVCEQRKAVVMEGLSALLNRDRTEAGVFTAAIYARRLSKFVDKGVLDDIDEEASAGVDRLMDLYEYGGSGDEALDLNVFVRALDYVAMFEDHYSRWPAAVAAMEEFRIAPAGEPENETEEDEDAEWVDGVVYEIMSSLLLADE
ncbi:restriction endonuclease [Actinomadura sp. 3N508]